MASREFNPKSWFKTYVISPLPIKLWPCLFLMNQVGLYYLREISNYLCLLRSCTFWKFSTLSEEVIKFVFTGIPATDMTEWKNVRIVCLTLPAPLQHPKLAILEKQLDFKDSWWEGISNMQNTPGEKWHKGRNTTWNKQNPSLEENIQRNRRKFPTRISIYRSSYYGCGSSLKKQTTWDY